jgi:hypothetical protein
MLFHLQFIAFFIAYISTKIKIFSTDEFLPRTADLIRYIFFEDGLETDPSGRAR